MRSVESCFARRRFLGLCSLGAAALAGGCGGSVEPEEMLVFREAMDAITAGDRNKGLELLSKCLAIKPTHYAYLERAKLYQESREIPKAIEDCKKGLELDPENKDLKWLLGELEKPEPQRFKGPTALPPSSKK